MGSSKKKKIILISSIGAGVLLISFLLILFFVTDIFKSPQQLFYKYLPQNMQLLDIVYSNLATSHNQKMQETSYTSNGEITLTYEMGPGEATEENDSATEMFKVITEAKVDNPNQKQYNKVTLAKNDQELLAVKYIRNADLYALGSDQIVTKYVAVENNNLKDIATKLGYQNVSQVPNKLQASYNLNEILQLTEEEKQLISKNYGTLIVKNINKNNFTKTKNIDITVDGQNYKSQKYTLTFTSQEIKDLTIKILKQLQNDDKTLNIILNKYYIVAQNEEMTIDILKQQIKQWEQKLNEQAVENVQIQISLYVSDNKLLETDVMFGEKIITIKYANNTKESKVIVKSETTDIQGFNTIELKKSENEEQYVLSVILSNSNDTQNTITIQTSRVGNVNSNTVRDLTILTVNTESDVYTIKYSNNINFENNLQIEELNDDNSVKLNDYTQEELQQLLNSIIERTEQVWNENLAKIESNGENEVSIENDNDQGNEEQGEVESQPELSSTEKLAIEMFNEQFLAYLGDNVQADNVKKMLEVTKTAIQNQNPIIVKYSGKYNNTEINKQVSTIEELEDLEIYIVSGKSYFVQGTADITGKLAELEIKENTNNT